MKLFEQVGCYRSMNAEADRLLEGRSYYYSAETRRFFKSRVSRLSVSIDRTLLVTVEKLPKGYRIVIHTYNGQRLYRSPGFLASLRQADRHYRMITEACNGHR